MNNLPLISVIIPVYNAAKTIEHCVGSVLSQDYENIEIILINDGSKDKSKDILNKLSDSHSNIYAYHFENAGAAEARNRGIEKAAGEYIAFIDSDDLILPNYLSYLHGLINEYNADIAVCSYSKLYAGKNTYTEKKSNSEIYNTEKEKSDNDYRVAFKREKAVENLLYQRHFISAPWGMISKKSLWKNVRFPKGKRAEDVATIYRLFAEADIVAYGEKKLYLYILRKTNTVFSTSSVLNPDYLSNCKDMVNYIKVAIPDILPAAKSRLFSACFQILSETPVNKKTASFVDKVYGVIDEIKKDILKDKKGKLRNRVAALLSCISIPFLHKLLRMYYIYNCKKLK